MLRHDKVIKGLTFSSDGRFLTTVVGDGSLQTWRGGSLVATAKGLHPDRSFFCAAAHGRFVAAALLKGGVGVWREDGIPMTTLAMGGAELCGMWWIEAEETKVMAAAQDGLAKMMVVGEGEQKVVVLAGHSAAIVGVAWGGGKIGTTSLDGTARVWLQNGACVALLDDGWSAVRSIAFSPGGVFAATAGDDGSVNVWSAHDGRLEVTLGCCGPNGESKRVEWAASTGGTTVILANIGDGKYRIAEWPASLVTHDCVP